MIKHIVSILLIFSSFTAFGQGFEFYREDIDFTLNDGVFKVNGYYYFRNETPDRIISRLIYPFPVDSCYGKIDSVSAVDMVSKLNKLLKSNRKSAIIELNLNPFDTAVINISYIQKLKSDKAEYILTTTQSWGKGFDIANYQLTTCPRIQIDSITYVPDTLQAIQGKTVYTWTKKNFMPDKNFVLFFRKGE
ncbi:MAG: hypothetical protein B6D61_02150 [Bacteroidetes bacterium 4484_249]|jgi:hypothetical protein|nr:MAG: hypothetical protein B6D61_02150 [Bacteroidetes bacterium 4484_249]